jgi:hypothetical protein
MAAKMTKMRFSLAACALCNVMSSFLKVFSHDRRLYEGLPGILKGLTEKNAEI